MSRAEPQGHGHRQDHAVRVQRVVAPSGLRPGWVKDHNSLSSGCRSTGAPVSFHGGPGATGRSYSGRPTIEASLRNRLLALPGNTVVRSGHGEDTTIAAERPHVPTA